MTISPGARAAGRVAWRLLTIRIDTSRNRAACRFFTIPGTIILILDTSYSGAAINRSMQEAGAYASAKTLAAYAAAGFTAPSVQCYPTVDEFSLVGRK